MHCRAAANERAVRPAPDPGGANTLGSNNYLEISPTGTLDLNGNVQYVQGLFTDGTYNGEVEVEVKHTNHHAKADNNTTKKYEVKNVRVTFGLADTNKDGSVGVDDLVKGDRVKLIGRITVLAKKCSPA